MGFSSLRATGLLCVVAFAGLAGCGASDSSKFPPGHDGGTTGSNDSSAYGDAPLFVTDSSTSGTEGGAATTFDVEPSALQTIAVSAGAMTPTVGYKATVDGKPVHVAWTVDRGDVASIGAGPSADATLRPTGTTGGLVHVIAGYKGKTLQRSVFIKISATQNGANAAAPGESQQIPTSLAQLVSGGGVGGVGGEGLGGPVTSSTTLTALKKPASDGSTEGLAFLYPYDQTVFPRGLLAPLIQWTWSTGDADAIQISLETTSGSFSYTGTFAAPAILAQEIVDAGGGDAGTGAPFIRMPIPQDVWMAATETAGGATPAMTADKLTLSLVLAKNGVGYGPIKETWSIAPAHLEGTVYYNSYGTQLIQNSLDLDHNGNEYGAAVLGIEEGATGPVVVAGAASAEGAGTGCRVCHVVSSNGSTLIAQHGDNYGETSSYGLTNGNAENVLANYDNTFGWAGLSADGTLALTNAGNMAANDSVTQLYAFPPAATGAMPLVTTGLPADLQAATPAFSPDTQHVAFDFLKGTIGTTTGNGTQLVALDFDAKTNAFSNLQVLATMTNGLGAGFPTFFPTDDAVAFHYQLTDPGAAHLFDTWQQATAQIWWSDLATGTASNLYALNGLTAGGASSYLPTGPNNHAKDTVLNYEPTANPVSSGGYIWIIFTSRRLYGSVATTDPWQSDPRQYDDTKLANTTCKKLWVAALDLNAKPGTDPSHPAFYLPAQELLAGNSRGFWALAPCKANGQSCMSGDECCNGYCEPGGADGGLVCTNKPPYNSCSNLGDKCTTSADCCDSSDLCVNGFCSLPTPPP